MREDYIGSGAVESFSPINDQTNARFNQPEPVVKDNTWTEEAAAALDTSSNLIATTVKELTGQYQPYRYDPGDDVNFNPSEHVPAGYEDYADEFAHASNKYEVEQITNDIKFKSNEYEAIKNGGWSAWFMQMGLGAADPTLALPAVGAVRGLATAARVGKGVATGAALTATAVGIQEGAKGVLDPMHLDINDAITTTAAAAVLGGVMGGAVGLISPGARAAHMDFLKRYYSPEDMATATKPQSNYTGNMSADTPSPYTQPVPASAIDATRTSMEPPNVPFEGVEMPVARPEAQNAMSMAEDPESTKLWNWNPQLAKVATMGFDSPTIRLANSESHIVRKANAMLFDNGLIMNRTVEGKSYGRSMENLMQQDDAHMMNINMANWADYTDYANISGKFQAAKAMIKGVQDPNLSWSETMDQVADVLMTGDHSNALPHVSKIAKRYEDFFEKSGQALVKYGVLKKEQLLDHYLTRVWNPDAIKANMDGLVSNLKAQAMRYAHEHPDYEFYNYTRKETDLVENPERDVPRLKASDMTDADFAKLAHEVAKEHAYNPNGRQVELETLLDKTRNNQKELNVSKHRTAWINSSEVKPWLVTDVDTIAGAYSRLVSAEVRSKQFVQRMGYDNVSQLLDAVRADGDLRAKDTVLEDGTIIKKTPAERNRIIEESIAMQKLLADSLAAQQGRLSKNDPLSRRLGYIRKYTLLNKLGNVFISSITDLAMPIFLHGLPRTMIRGWGSMITNPEMFNMNKRQLQNFGVGIEMKMNAVLRNLAEPGDVVGHVSTNAEKMMDFAVAGFGKATFISQWTAGGKAMAGHMSLYHTIDDLMQWAETGKMSQKSTARLARFGIDVDQWQGIVDQVKKHSADYNNTKVVDLSLWDDIAAKEAIGGQVLAEVNNTILKPSAGDVFITAQKNPIVGMMTQFGSFMMAATNKILLSGMQRRDAEVAQGIIALFMLGMLSSQIKNIQNGRGVEKDLKKLSLSGLQGSGLMGWGTDKVSSLVFPSSYGRYAERSFAASLAGPAAGIGENVFKTGREAIRAMFENDKAKQTTAMKMAYSNAWDATLYQNLMSWRKMLAKIWPNAGKAVGVFPKKENK